MAKVTQKSLRKILIANRGEIAVRIIRACREMGISSVAVFSDADSESLHVKLADEAVRIGEGPATDSYLRADKILDAAKRTGVDAIHPGYGLLSENSAFAKEIERRGLTFIGPSPAAIESMGNKTAARQRMLEAGVPIVPGSDGPIEDISAALEVAKKIGFPVLIKAVSGGGGRGMRVVEDAPSFGDAFESAGREARSAFGDGSLYLEKYLGRPRHVEIQVLADQYGNTIYLGERECSVQRRHQKIIEETPCAVLTPELRSKMGNAAVQAARAVNYFSAGTVEFLLNEDGHFYFIEMNTRLQVEHPITEMTYGIDLVAAQIDIASGKKIPYDQEDLQPKGAAIECRICAEDPEENFQPCPGEITGLRLPGGPGVRIDTYVYSGYSIPVHYDPMFCKLVTFAATREQAINRMIGALRELQIQGVRTNVQLLQRVLAHPKFCAGDYTIHFLRDYLSGVLIKKQEETAVGSTKKTPEDLPRIAAIAAAVAEFHKRHLGVETHQKNRDSKNLTAWKLPTQSWKLTGLRRQMDRGV